MANLVDGSEHDVRLLGESKKTKTERTIPLAVKRGEQALAVGKHSKRLNSPSKASSLDKCDAI